MKILERNKGENKMNRRQFLGKLGTAFLAGTIATTAPGLLSASESPDETLASLENTLTFNMHEDNPIRISYLAKGEPASHYDVGKVIIHNKGQTIKIIDAEGYAQEADEVPDLVTVDDAMICSKKKCGAYKDKFVKLRDGLIEHHLKNVENFVTKGNYIITADEGKSYFIEDHSGFISVLSPDKRFKYNFVDMDGDGTPEEIEIKEYRGQKSRVVVSAVHDRFTSEHFKGIMGRLYGEMEKHEAAKKPSMDYKSETDSKKNDCLDKTLDNALESLMR
jgi:hypothetical protein